MVTLNEILEAVAARLNEHLSGMQITAYVLSSPTLPCIEVEPAEVDYDGAFHNGLFEWSVIVRPLVAFSNDIAAQRNLYAYYDLEGRSSILAAFQADETLGLTNVQAHVSSAGRPTILVRDGRPAAIGAEFTVTVIAS